MIGTCRCGSPFLRLFDDLGCVGCGRQCCWGCAVVIEAVAYCVRCAEVLLEVSPPSGEGVVHPARREPHFSKRAAHPDDERQLERIPVLLAPGQGDVHPVSPRDNEGLPVRDNIRDVMSSRPKTLDADQTVAAAAQLMRGADIGDVLVVKSDDRLHGILTDRDIVVRVLGEGLDPNQTRVGDICSRVLTTVSPDDGVSHAVRVMREKAIRRLPVEAGGRVIGMLTIGDIAVKRDVGSVLADISAAPPNT
jgi:CBS domain-containing protein